MRPIYFVCAAILDNQLIMETIEANEQMEAEKLFVEKYQIVPQRILGQFHIKKNKPVPKPIKTETLQFAAAKPKMAKYQEWQVQAFPLTHPADHAYIMFISHPTNIQTLPIDKTILLTELEFYNETK